MKVKKLRWHPQWFERLRRSSELRCTTIDFNVISIVIEVRLAVSHGVKAKSSTGVPTSTSAFGRHQLLERPCRAINLTVMHACLVEVSCIFSDCNPAIFVLQGLIGWLFLRRALAWAWRLPHTDLQSQPLPESISTYSSTHFPRHFYFVSIFTRQIFDMRFLNWL